MASRFVDQDDSCEARVTVTRALRLHAPAGRAFTLLEVVLVIAIMAIFSAIAVPRYANSVSLSRVETAARRVAADLDFARAQAMTASKPQPVVFSVATNTYQLTGQVDPVRRAMAYLTDLSVEPYKSTLVSATFGGSATVTFDLYGMPSSAGTIVVRSGSRQKSIILDATSGRTTIK